MKSSFKPIRIITSFVIVVLIVLIIAPTQAFADPTITNPGFESGSASPWVAVNSPSVTTGSAHSGTYKAEMDAAYEEYYQWVSNVTALANYECWGYIQTTGNVTGRIEFEFYDSLGGSMLGAKILEAKNTVGWEMKSSPYRAPIDTRYLKVRLTVASLDSGEEVWFDDIGFKAQTGGCFIATAAYGPDDSTVNTLRNFRDGQLLTSSTGQSLVDAYYSVSPPIAEFVDDNSSLKPLIKASLLPAVAVSSVSTDTTLGPKITVISILMLCSITFVCMLMKKSRKNMPTPIK